ncbi:PDZ domain-containing protein [Azospirillum sp. B506]|uniref:PDZ domain-containing protein n=1 Tax=Azospirillum sp. B506 TaxID=137721 RepID=UPI0003449DF1|nr:PDZ domain-containing protein [Azospirillum sp. B506]
MSEPQGRVGISVAPVTDQPAQAVGLAAPRGVLVVELMPGETADVSGVRPGDVILDVRGVPAGAVHADAPDLMAAPVAPLRERFCVAQLMTSGASVSGVRSPWFSVGNTGGEAEVAKVTTAFQLPARELAWSPPTP